MTPGPEPHEFGTYHPPATTSLVPEPAAFFGAGQSDSEAIIEATGIPGKVEEIAGILRRSFFRLTSPDGQSYFVKRVRRANLKSQQASDGIAAWLQERGVDTTAAISRAPVGDGMGDVFFVTRYVDWRPIAPDRQDMAKAGAALADLHRALRDHPDGAAWQATTDTRLSRLSALRTEIAEGRLEPRIAREAVQAICRDSAGFVPAQEQIQPLHGDLHLFNILMPITGGRDTPIFIDFEDVGHSVLPVRFELALFIERAILIREPDDERAATLSDGFLYAYFGGDKRGTARFKNQAVDTLRALSTRSLCVLADIERSGMAVEDAEWIKFVDLYLQAGRRAAVFGAT